MEFYEEDLSWKEKILNFILECAEVQKLVPFSLIEEEFNLILDEALKSVITDALWDNDTISDVTIGTDGFTVTVFRELIVNIKLIN